MKRFDPRTLPYLGALVQAVLFALAGYLYFDMGAWGAVAGFGVGAVVNLSLAVASSRISEVSQKRQFLARLALGVMIVLSPATIALSFFAPKTVFAAITWAADVDIAIVLTGAIAGKSLVKQDETPKVASKETGKPASKARKPAKVAPQVARKAIPDTELLAYLQANPGESHQQVAEHFGVSRQAVGQRVKKLYEVKQ
jgi:hypothetical protein